VVEGVTLNLGVIGDFGKLARYEAAHGIVVTVFLRRQELSKEVGFLVRCWGKFVAFFVRQVATSSFAIVYMVAVGVAVLEG
jgi:hypothetical protein